MSETAATTSHDIQRPHPEIAVPLTPAGPPVDGDAPRLGSGPLSAPAPLGSTTDASPTVASPDELQPTIGPAPVAGGVDGVATSTLPAMPTSSSVMAVAAIVDTPHDTTAPTIAPDGHDIVAPVLPTLPTGPSSAQTYAATNAPAPDIYAPDPSATNADAPDLPTLPVVSAVSESSPSDDVDDDVAESAANTDPQAHPMAHLMGAKAKPSEATLRAIELRAQKKAKAKRRKIIVVGATLVVSVLVGPPLAMWLGDAISSAGSAETSE